MWSDVYWSAQIIHACMMWCENFCGTIASNTFLELRFRSRIFFTLKRKYIWFCHSCFRKWLQVSSLWSVWIFTHDTFRRHMCEAVMIAQCAPVLLPEAACDLPGSSTQTFPSPISASTEEEQIICLQTKTLTGVWQLWRIGNICIRCTGKFPLRLRAVRRFWGATSAMEHRHKKEKMDPFRRQS